MAVDMFLKIEGEIAGEAQDKEHKGDIDVLAWSWGMSQSGSFHVGGGGGAGKASFQDISVTKWVDNASAVLMLYCANGDHFAKAQLSCRKAGKTPLEYLVIDMTKVMITSVSTGGSGGEDRLTENVTLNFAKVEVKYKEQQPDGSGGPEKLFKWDIAQNTDNV
ncbi:MAG: type VI secretion system tube protein Hcp [Planctomycetota bacterium]